MIYYDPNTRKRPQFERVWMKVVGDGISSTGISYIVCVCGQVLTARGDVFWHWDQGHFDEYDEYKGKEK
jgi:hypothetical protein